MEVVYCFQPTCLAPATQERAHQSIQLEFPSVVFQKCFLVRAYLSLKPYVDWRINTAVNGAWSSERDSGISAHH
jgi:hypothetical protein